MSEENLTLSEQQKQLILDIWNQAPADDPPSLINLVQFAWGQGVDPRSKKGRLVREFLVSRQLKPKLAKSLKTDSINLSEEDKAYIKTNCAENNATEMARAIFENDKLTNLSAETRVVATYLSTLTIPKTPEEVPLNDYKPPVTIPQVISRVNTYIKDELKEEKLNGKQKKDLKALIGYLHTFLFCAQANAFETINERQLFESEFVRCTYDKHDLTEEEVDQYITYSTEVVISKGILRRISNLEKEQDATIQESGKMSMAIVEAVKTLRQDYKASVKTQNDLLAALKVKRSERLSSVQKDNASILNLVQLFKEEETRIDMAKLAQQRQEVVSEDIDKIATMDELIAKVLGISKSEALYG